MVTPSVHTSADSRPTRGSRKRHSRRTCASGPGSGRPSSRSRPASRAYTWSCAPHPARYRHADSHLDAHADCHLHLHPHAYPVFDFNRDPLRDAHPDGYSHIDAVLDGHRHFDQDIDCDPHDDRFADLHPDFYGHLDSHADLDSHVHLHPHAYPVTVDDADEVFDGDAHQDCLVYA